MVLLAGCQTSPAYLYQWGDYQPAIYKHFKGESPSAQISTLEKNLADMQAPGSLAPPGLHAHLGMLYSTIGKNDQSAQEFLTEKKLFPESAIYMDFLLSKIKKQGQ